MTNIEAVKVELARIRDSFIGLPGQVVTQAWQDAGHAFAAAMSGSNSPDTHTISGFIAAVEAESFQLEGRSDQLHEMLNGLIRSLL
jgi:hypothetical protein